MAKKKGIARDPEHDANENCSCEQAAVCVCGGR